MRKQPEVMECFFTTGSADIMLRVAIPSVAAYDHFLERRRCRSDGEGLILVTANLRRNRHCHLLR
jgi:DNA-binding Lrp family transcriptional regulator